MKASGSWPSNASPRPAPSWKRACASRKPAARSRLWLCVTKDKQNRNCMGRVQGPARAGESQQPHGPKSARRGVYSRARIRVELAVDRGEPGCLRAKRPGGVAGRQGAGQRFLGRQVARRSWRSQAGGALQGSPLGPIRGGALGGARACADPRRGGGSRGWATDAGNLLSRERRALCAAVPGFPGSR